MPPHTPLPPMGPWPTTPLPLMPLMEPDMTTVTPRPHPSVLKDLTFPTVSLTRSIQPTTLLPRSPRTLSSSRSMLTLLISLLMTLLMALPSLKRNTLTTATTPEHLRDQASMTLPTGLDLRDTSVPLMLTMPRSPALSMLRATGESSSNTFLTDMDMVTTTTPKPPDWRPVCSLTAPADSWHPATSPSAHRSLSTTECCLWTPVILTEDSSLIHTSSPVLALAIFQLNS